MCRALSARFEAPIDGDDHVSRAVLRSVLGPEELDFDKKVVDFTNNPYLAPLVKAGVKPVIWESELKPARRTVLNPIDNQGQQLLVDWIGAYFIFLLSVLLTNLLMLSLCAESLCLVDGKHNIVPPIIPEAQEFVHVNNLWCYLFYKLTGEEKQDKGIAAFTIVPSKNLTISALLETWTKFSPPSLHQTTSHCRTSAPRRSPTSSPSSWTASRCVIRTPSIPVRFSTRRLFSGN